MIIPFIFNCFFFPQVVYLWFLTVIDFLTSHLEWNHLRISSKIFCPCIIILVINQLILFSSTLFWSLCICECSKYSGMIMNFCIFFLTPSFHINQIFFNILKHGLSQSKDLYPKFLKLLKIRFDKSWMEFYSSVIYSVSQFYCNWYFFL